MNIQRTAVEVALLLTLAQGSLWAREPMLKANIPFDFVVAETALPSGSYIIEPLMDKDNVAWVLRSKKGHLAVEFLTNESEHFDPAKETSLVFNAIGGKHFLSGIWVQGGKFGWQLIPGRAERELRHKGMKPEKKKVPGTHAASKHS